MKNTKQLTQLIDSTGFIWVSAMLTDNQVDKLVKKYNKYAGVQLTIKAVK